MNIINKQLKMSGCENVKVTQILLILLLAKVFSKRNTLNFSGNKQLHVEWIPDNMVQ